jgi:hypothetical protein
MLNVGFLEGLTTDQMNLIQKMLTQRCENANNMLFDLPLSEDLVVNQFANFQLLCSGCACSCRVHHATKCH